MGQIPKQREGQPRGSDGKAGASWSRWTRWTRWVIALVSGGLLAGGCLWLRGAAEQIYRYQDTVDGVHLPQVDAIICLAGGRGRIAAAGDLWFRYWQMREKEVQTGKGEFVPPPVLFFSGLGSRSTWNTVRRQLRSGVMDVIDPKQVILETQSTSTEENAQWLLQYARERQWKSVLLVTSRYHMRRARWIVERLEERDRELRRMLRPSGALAPAKLRIETLSVYQEPFEPGEWSTDVQGIQVTMTEYLKWLYFAHFWRPVLYPQLLSEPEGERGT